MGKLRPSEGRRPAQNHPEKWELNPGQNRVSSSPLRGVQSVGAAFPRAPGPAVVPGGLTGVGADRRWEVMGSVLQEVTRQGWEGGE